MDKKTVISERPDTQEKTTVKESQKPEEAQLQVGQQLQSERNWTKSLLSDAATQLVTLRSQLSI